MIPRICPARPRSDPAQRPHSGPPAVRRLRTLAYNLWWMWHPRAALLFSRLEPNTWSRYRNPVALLQTAINWEPLLEDPGFIAEYDA